MQPFAHNYVMYEHALGVFLQELQCRNSCRHSTFRYSVLGVFLQELGLVADTQLLGIVYMYMYMQTFCQGFIQHRGQKGVSHPSPPRVDSVFPTVNKYM